MHYPSIPGFSAGPPSHGIYATGAPYPAGHTGSEETDQETRRAPARSADEKLTFMLESLKGINWTVSEFLYHLFRVKDKDNQRIHRTQSHGIIISKFLSGQTRYTPIQIIKEWFIDHSAEAEYD